MIPATPAPIRNTPHQVVLPFYLYAAVFFIVATVLLLLSGSAFTQHFFHPRTLAITHSMALGWGTMMILGASHQLVPVLIERKLYSNTLGYISFALAALGIPLLIYGFYIFDFGHIAQCGALLINLAIVVYLMNMAISMSKSEKENIHAKFMLTAILWLLLTTIIGGLLTLNFTLNFLTHDSLHYLSLHAHIGIVGWFLMTVVGIGSRLIPMFLISKYDNVKLLNRIYLLINFALILFVVLFLFYNTSPALQLIPAAGVLFALVWFAIFCRNCYKNRLRKTVDAPLRMSLLSVAMLALPLLILFILIIVLVWKGVQPSLVLAYGFCIFFGWITAIILGMTFKTLPFILWNKTYHSKAGKGRTPNPKDLFSLPFFNAMSLAYLVGFILFLGGILLKVILLLQSGAVLLLAAAVLYGTNVIKMVAHRPIKFDEK